VKENFKKFRERVAKHKGAGHIEVVSSQISRKLFQKISQVFSEKKEQGRGKEQSRGKQQRGKKQS